MKTLRIGLVATALATLAAAMPARAAQPFGTTPCSGVRPGAMIQAPKGTEYSMSFIFKGKGPKGTAYYTVTVGNFAFPGFGTKKWPVGGPQVYNSSNKAIGRFIYAEHTDTPAFSTFGLVQLDKKVKPNPQMCHFGGPTGIYASNSPVPGTVEYYGQGFPSAEIPRARTAITTGTPDRDSVYVQGLFSTDSGDTGVPALLDGKALGFADGGIGEAGAAGGGFVVARLGPWLDKVERILKIELVLQTAKRL